MYKWYLTSEFKRERKETELKVCKVILVHFTEMDAEETGSKYNSGS
jgi:hypothetical protein